jgi:hypothetical protein
MEISAGASKCEPEATPGGLRGGVGAMQPKRERQEIVSAFDDVRMKVRQAVARGICLIGRMTATVKRHL